MADIKTVLHRIARATERSLRATGNLVTYKDIRDGNFR